MYLGFPGGSDGKAAVREAQVQSLGWEDPLEKEMPTHSSTLAWKIPWTEEPGRLQSMGSQRVRHDWATSLYHVSRFLDVAKAFLGYISVYTCEAYSCDFF